MPSSHTPQRYLTRQRTQPAPRLPYLQTRPQPVQERSHQFLISNRHCSSVRDLGISLLIIERIIALAEWDAIREEDQEEEQKENEEGEQEDEHEEVVEAAGKGEVLVV